MNDKGYSKFQYSEFLHNGHDAQYVVRTDDKEEFELLVTYVQSKIPSRPQTSTTTSPTAPQTEIDKAFNQPAPGMPDTIPTDLKVCKKCGGKMVVNPKNGNIFCANKCWLKS